MRQISPSVLIIRLDAIGDALALTPLLAAFGRRGLAVDVVLRNANSGIFSPLAARDIITAGFDLRSSTRSTLAEIERLGGELRGRGYSHVLVATEDPGGYRLARAVGAPARIGFADGRGKPLKALWSQRFLTQTIYRSAGLDASAPHECEVLFSLAESLLGDERPTRDPAKLRPLVIEDEPVRDDRIAVQITDKWERLGIPFEEVIDLIARLGASGTVRLLSARSETAYAERIAQSAGLSIGYFDELAPWKSAIGASRAIVTPDSGALHVAGMTGTPVVAIFPAQPHYALNAARWAPWAAPHRIVASDDGWPRRTTDAIAELLAT